LIRLVLSHGEGADCSARNFECPLAGEPGQGLPCGIRVLWFLDELEWQVWTPAAERRHSRWEVWRVNLSPDLPARRPLYDWLDSEGSWFPLGHTW